MTEQPLFAASPGRPPFPRDVPNVPMPVPADPDDPMRVVLSHLKKTALGKSSGFNKVSLVTRLHRQAALQEFWCASWEEYWVIKCVAAMPAACALAEQFTRIDYEDEDGKPRWTLIDLHVAMRDGFEYLVSTKYREKAHRPSYRAEIARIAKQVPRRVADGFAIASRFSFPKPVRACAEDVHHARRAWDPEADQAVQEAADALGDHFYFGELVDRSRLEEGRGWRAAVRLIADGEIGKHDMDPFEARTVCWGVKA